MFLCIYDIEKEIKTILINTMELKKMRIGAKELLEVLLLGQTSKNKKGHGLTICIKAENNIAKFIVTFPNGIIITTLKPCECSNICAYNFYLSSLLEFTDKKRKLDFSFEHKNKRICVEQGGLSTELEIIEDNKSDDFLYRDSMLKVDNFLPKMIDFCLYATEKTKDVSNCLNYVQAELKNNNDWRFSSLNGHICPVYTEQNLSLSKLNKMSFLFHYDFLELAKKLFYNNKNILFGFDDDFLYFEFKNTSIKTKRVKISYPSIDSFLARVNQAKIIHEIDINKKEFVKALKDVKAYNKDGFILLDLQNENKITIYSDCTKENCYNHEVECVSSGSINKIGFNLSDLLLVLDSMSKSKSINIKLTSLEDAFLISGDKEKGYQVINMPVKTR